ncbi:MAG: EAL domain-containing protein [Gloeomargarita sp. SRBZ-1_bins_9]
MRYRQFLKGIKKRLGRKHRSLAVATLQPVALILVTAVFVFAFLSWRLVSWQLDAFDAASYRQDVQRVSAVLRRDADVMLGFVRDYATWDEIYDYVRGQNGQFVEKNFTLSTLSQLHFHGAAIVGETGRVWTAFTWDDQGRRQPLPPTVLQWLVQEARRGAHRPAAHYFLWLGQRPVAIAAAPVTDTQNQKSGQARFYLLRYLDGPYHALIQQLTATSFVFTGETGLQVVRRGEMWMVHQRMAPGMEICVQGKTRLAGQRQLMGWLFLLNGGLLVLVCLGGTYWVWQKRVLRRLSLFADRAVAARETQDVHIRWPVQGEDELDHLARALNQLQATLARHQAELQQLVYYDSLTGLANRRFLLDYLNQLPASPSVHALMLLDLDHFKKVNDANGHLRGDELLVEVGNRLRQTMPAEALVARLGGDEFVVVLPEVAPETTTAATIARQIAQTILETLAKPFFCPYGEYGLTASIGITLFRTPLEDVYTLLQQADAAMYRSKATGRNRSSLFHPQLQVHIQRRAHLEQDLSAALEKGQLTIHYQPQVTDDHRLWGVEALVRWRHPHQGWVPPAAFIPVAEDNGLMVPLGNWVLTAACTQLARWADHPVLSQGDMAVNVSARQVHQPDFVPQLLTILEHTGANPHRLVLELTETVMLEDLDRVGQKLKQLRAAGVRLALDDFGLGYSALRYLKRLPLSQLKIDRLFVRHVLENPHDQAIVRMILALGETLHLDVLAEGVEQEGQRDFLVAQGCRIYQGYLFAPPLPVEELETWVAQRAMMGKGVEQ